MKVGICAIIKDCNPKYLQEWIEWHRLLGVDYFFIYDNESATPITSKFSFVIVKPFKGKVQQLNAYNDCISLQKNGQLPKCDWIAFIDDDEFIIVESGSIKQFLLSKKENAGVALNWLTFGASEKEDFDIPQILKYQRHVPFNHPINKHVKIIVRPEYTQDFWNPHSANMEKGYIKSVKGEILIRSPFVDLPCFSEAWINHYYCKSEKEFLEKVKRGRADTNLKHQMNSFYELDKQATLITDKTLIISGLMNTKSKEVIVMRDEAGKQGLKSLISEIQQTHDTKKMTMVEIGSYAGESTVIFAEHFKKVIAIDPFIEGYDEKDPTCYCAPLSTVVYEAFKERTKFFNNIVHIRKTSDDAVEDIDKIDFVYIDGNHEYEQVKKDILNYLPKIKKGAYIGGHDFVVTHPAAWAGVKKAVLELLGMPDMLFKEGSWLKQLK